MLFMVIEHFKNRDPAPIYARFREKGRMASDKLKYHGSWIEPNFARCFQVMECDDLRCIQRWMLERRGSGISFEIIPVVGSKDTQEVVKPYLEP